MSFLEAQLENGRQKFKSQEYKIRKTNFYGVYITCIGQILFQLFIVKSYLNEILKYCHAFSAFGFMASART